MEMVNIVKKEGQTSIDAWTKTKQAVHEKIMEHHKGDDLSKLEEGKDEHSGPTGGDDDEEKIEL